MPLARLKIPQILLFVVAASVFTACDREVIRETEAFSDGTPAWEREYVLSPASRKVAHGTHSTWHRSGTRRTLEFFKAGRREGFAFEWNQTGDLVRLSACEAGVCRDRALPERPIRTATVLAGTRFR